MKPVGRTRPGPASLYIGPVRASMVLWVAVIVSLITWASLPGYSAGWDVRIYRAALDSLRAGHDPYLDALTIQRAYYAHLEQHQHEALPFSYIYSPITLTPLKALARLPYPVLGGVYWTVYAFCAVLLVRYGAWAATAQERRVLAVVAPVCLHFPGLLQHDSILSGNIAILIYGSTLTAVIYGWRRGKWVPFYAAVLVASCFKAPMLCLLAIPVLSARGQVRDVCLSAVLGVVLFVVQPRIWPALFAHYLQALDFQFRFNRDFSSSPAGVVADLLFQRVPYEWTSGVVYGLCALGVGWSLLHLSRRYRTGAFSLQQWAPVLTLGVFLLNPRLMEYDLLPLSLPMLLIVWRSFREHYDAKWLAGSMFVIFLVLNACMLLTQSYKPIECVLLLTIFCLGCRHLWRQGDVSERGATSSLTGRTEAVSH